jgi:hypothetical protein
MDSILDTKLVIATLICLTAAYIVLFSYHQLFLNDRGQNPKPQTGQGKGKINDERGQVRANEIEQQKLLRRAREFIAASSPLYLDPEYNTLCHRCNRIDFDDAFMPLSTSDRLQGRKILRLPGIANVNPSSKCPLCRMFSSMANDPDAIRGHCLRAFDSQDTMLHENYCEMSLKRGRMAAGVVLGVQGDFGQWDRQEHFAPAQGLVCQVIPPSLKGIHTLSLNGCLVHPTRINYNTLRGWLGHCQKFHIQSCGLQGKRVSRPASLKFIDCHSRNIVPSRSSEDYFTLSYVWGPLSNDSLRAEQRGSTKTLLNSGVPRVVEDAVTAVRNLGARYLWVDRYCIDQENTQERHDQIARMDQIYEGATATLVAATDQDSISGLPGVGSVPRRAQPIAIVGEKVLVSSLAHISAPLEASVWITRGWTYQEAILSRRCLFFTNCQVYFVCRAMTCQETVETPLETTCSHIMSSESTDSMLMLDIFERDKFVLRNPSTTSQLRKHLLSFLRHLVQYKSRQLSYEDDSLNALKGLLARSPFHSLWGVPILSELEMGFQPGRVNMAFAVALWWRPSINKIDRTRLPTRRRPGFPSWSWTGWAGEIQSSILEDLEFDPRGIRVPIPDVPCFWIERKAGELVSLEQLCHSTTHTTQKIIPETSHTLLIEAWTTKIQLQRLPSQSRGRAGVCACHPNSRHDDDSTPYYKYHEVMFCESSTDNARFEDRLFDTLWDCILLFERTNQLHCWVINQSGSSPELLGMLQLFCDKFMHLSWERRRVRLA